MSWLRQGNHIPHRKYSIISLQNKRWQSNSTAAISNGRFHYIHVPNARIPNAHPRRELQSNVNLSLEWDNHFHDLLTLLTLFALIESRYKNKHLISLLFRNQQTWLTVTDLLPSLVLRHLCTTVASTQVTSTSTPSTVRPHTSDRYICTRCNMPHNNSAHFGATTHNVVAHDSNTHNGVVTSRAREIPTTALDFWFLGPYHSGIIV